MPSKTAKSADKTERIYCMKCDQHVIVTGPEHVVRKNGRHALVGTCPHCEKTVCKFVKSPNP